jgi:hypothetical protein
MLLTAVMLPDVHQLTHRLSACQTQFNSHTTQREVINTRHCVQKENFCLCLILVEPTKKKNDNEMYLKLQLESV